MPTIHPAGALLCAEALSQWELRHPDGSLYLRRHVLAGVDALEHHCVEAPYSVFIHEIATADGDRHLHNHPWAWAVALVLSGGYDERRGDGAARSYDTGDINILRPGDYHSITSVEPGTMTLFLCGREVADWGFQVDGLHVPHAEYFKRADAQHMTTVRL